MLSVETLVSEDQLIYMMQTMRTWLDHKRFEPATFRCSLTSAGILCRVEFSAEDEAAGFAEAFQGMIVGETAT